MILQLNHHPAATKSLLNFCFRPCDVLSVTFWPCNKNRFAVFTNFSSPFLKHSGCNSQLDPTQPHTADGVVAELVPIFLITSWSQTTVFPSCHCSIIKPNLRAAAIKDPTVIVGICKVYFNSSCTIHFYFGSAEERCRKSNKASCIFIGDFLKSLHCRY